LINLNIQANKQTNTHIIKTNTHALLVFMRKQSLFKLPKALDDVCVSKRDGPRVDDLVVLVFVGSDLSNRLGLDVLCSPSNNLRLLIEK
jgi:hypothetical protein